jgi:hypothetical protein
MPKQKIVNCPMKFNSKTLEPDGYVKKILASVTRKTVPGGGIVQASVRY